MTLASRPQGSLISTMFHKQAVDLQAISQFDDFFTTFPL
jgi:hypothetical protein